MIIITLLKGSHLSLSDAVDVRERGACGMTGDTRKIYAELDLYTVVYLFVCVWGGVIKLDSEE